MTVTIGRRKLLAAFGGAAAAWPLAATSAKKSASAFERSHLRRAVPEARVTVPHLTRPLFACSTRQDGSHQLRRCLTGGRSLAPSV